MTSELPSSAPRSESRASHADRDAVVERLQEAAAEGRLDFGELETRLERALGAKTFGELDLLTEDLPPVAGPDPDRPLVVKGGLHGAKRTGAWQVPAQIAAHGGMAGVKLDFTRAVCRLPLVEVEVHGEFAGVVLVLPDDWAADTGDVDPGFGGVRDRTSAERRPGAPLLRITGTGGPAGVVVRHPNAWERRRLRREARG